MKIALTDLAVQRLKPGTYFDTKTPAFGIRVGKNRKTWIITKGRERKVLTLGHYPSLTLQDARKRAQTAFTAPTPTRSSPTFPEALNAYLAQAVWKPRTRYTVEKCLRKHFTWTKRLDQISYQDVLTVLDALTPGARAEALKNIRAFFNWCIPRHIEKSPLVGVKTPNYTPRARVLSDRELTKVWNAATTMGTFGRIVQLLILTGQRRNEIASLIWPQIEDDKVTLWDTKNGREHVFPLGLLAAITLPPEAKGIVFPVKGTDNPFSAWSKSLKLLHKKSGTADWSLHDLRRTFATGLASLGVAIHVTEKLLNHVSGSTGGIVGVYQRHSYWTEQVEAIQKWENRLSSLVR